MLSTEFLLTSLVVALIPGTGVIYTVSSGLFYGFRASVVAAFGCTLGTLPHLLASILGLSFLLQLSATVFQGLKVAGAVYLLYLAWTLRRERGARSFDMQPFDTQSFNMQSFEAAPKQTVRQIVTKGVLLNVLNPKLTLFFFAFLPLSISPDAASPLAALLFLSLIFMVITFAVFTLYGALASRVRQWVVRSPTVLVWLRRSFAVAFAALGLRLALTSR